MKFTGKGDRSHAATASPHPRPLRGRRAELQIHALRRQRRGEHFYTSCPRLRELRTGGLKYLNVEFTQPKTAIYTQFTNYSKSQNLYSGFNFCTGRVTLRSLAAI